MIGLSLITYTTPVAGGILRIPRLETNSILSDLTFHTDALVFADLLFFLKKITGPNSIQKFFLYIDCLEEEYWEEFALLGDWIEMDMMLASSKWKALQYVELVLMVNQRESQNDSFTLETYFEKNIYTNFIKSRFALLQLSQSISLEVRCEIF